MSVIIKIQNLIKTYENGNIKALNGIDLEIEEGEFVSIIGQSGSGKSTLLNMIGFLDVPDSGTIEVAGINLKETKHLDEFRSKKIGFIFQLHNLIPNLTVQENVEIPIYETSLNSKARSERALYLLSLVGLKDKVNMKPTKLSGGERQRVAIARALANNPSIILADEPTGSLDSKTSKEVLDLILELHEKENVTIVLVTHDTNVANLANRCIEVLDGKIISG
ncbi:MAG: ABC transporter ATP-binding protein [Methanobrevibacter sp.]|jgi:putative ABC transport system ATP-binding protein|nr:ABC transporter ATP-binding protein [Methanobrevibacter sp.]